MSESTVVESTRASTKEVMPVAKPEPAASEEYPAEKSRAISNEETPAVGVDADFNKATPAASTQPESNGAAPDATIQASSKEEVPKAKIEASPEEGTSVTKAAVNSNEEIPELNVKARSNKGTPTADVETNSKEEVPTANIDANSNEETPAANIDTKPQQAAPSKNLQSDSIEGFSKATTEIKIDEANITEISEASSNEATPGAESKSRAIEVTTRKSEDEGSNADPKEKTNTQTITKPAANPVPLTTIHIPRIGIPELALHRRGNNWFLVSPRAYGMGDGWKLFSRLNYLQPGDSAPDPPASHPHLNARFWMRNGMDWVDEIFLINFDNIFDAEPQVFRDTGLRRKVKIVKKIGWTDIEEEVEERLVEVLLREQQLSQRCAWCGVWEYNYMNSTRHQPKGKGKDGRPMYWCGDCSRKPKPFSTFWWQAPEKLWDGDYFNAKLPN